MKFIKILLILFVLNSCKKNDVKDIGIEVYRFDKELFTINDSNFADKWRTWGSELDFVHQYYFVIHEQMTLDTDSVIKSNVIDFISHPDVLRFKQLIDDNFENLDKTSNSFNKAFVEYNNYFPDSTVPKRIVTLPFDGVGIDVYNDNLLIGLNKYLGEAHPYFNSIDSYKRERMNKKFIVADGLEYWITSTFLEYNQGNHFLDELIYKGKIMYTIYQCMPDSPLEDIFRFSEEELQWCEKHEQNIWNEILKMDVMYESDELSYVSFFHDSPFTKGMPKESPGRLGYFVGYKIIESYMKENDISLKELMKNTNSQEILLQSKYIPGEKDQESWFKKYWWVFFIFICFLGYFTYNNYVKK